MTGPIVVNALPQTNPEECKPDHNIDQLCGTLATILRSWRTEHKDGDARSTIEFMYSLAMEVRQLKIITAPVENTEPRLFSGTKEEILNKKIAYQSRLIEAKQRA